MMGSDQKHTPGPWEAVGTRVWETARECQARQGIASTQEGRDEDRANAALIAAAPDLLAACEQVVRGWTPDCDPVVAFAVIENVRAAIAKATQQ